MWIITIEERGLTAGHVDRREARQRTRDTVQEAAVVPSGLDQSVRVSLRNRTVDFRIRLLEGDEAFERVVFRRELDQA